MSLSNIESKAFTRITLLNLIMSISGFLIFYFTGIQALLLDAGYALISALTNIVAFFISKYKKSKSKYYPQGLYFLEPLYGLIKGIIILTLLSATLYHSINQAYDYFNGISISPLNFGPLIPYEIIQVFLCFYLYRYTKKINKSVNNKSILLDTETKSSKVDGLLSFGILLAIIFLKFIALDSPLSFLHYIGDSIITLALSFFIIKEPIEIIYASFSEISGKVILNHKINSIVQESINAFSLNCKTFEIRKLGSQYSIKIYLHPDKLSILSNDKIEQLSSQINNRLSGLVDYINLEIATKI